MYSHARNQLRGYIFCARNRARKRARNAARNRARNAARNRARNPARNRARNAARNRARIVHLSRTPGVAFCSAYNTFLKIIKCISKIIKYISNIFDLYLMIK